MLPPLASDKGFSWFQFQGSSDLVAQSAVKWRIRSTCNHPGASLETIRGFSSIKKKWKTESVHCNPCIKESVLSGLCAGPSHAHHSSSWIRWPGWYPAGTSFPRITLTEVPWRKNRICLLGLPVIGPTNILINETEKESWSPGLQVLLDSGLREDDTVCRSVKPVYSMYIRCQDTISHSFWWLLSKILREKAANAAIRRNCKPMHWQWKRKMVQPLSRNWMEPPLKGLSGRTGQEQRGVGERRDRDRQSDKEKQRQREEGLRPGRVAHTCNLSTYKARGLQRGPG